MVDADRDGVAEFQGYANRFGQPVEGCSGVSLDCVPLILDGISMDVRGYQGRFGYREYDVYFGRQSSGWLQFPYP